MKGKIKITRENPGYGQAGNYGVFIDDKKVGTLRAEETLEIDAEIGTHTIQTKWFFFKSKRIEFDLKDEIDFVCGETRDTESSIGKFYLRQIENELAETGNPTSVSEHSPVESSDIKESFMYCPACGKNIPDSSKFCLHCGEAITVSSVNVVEKPAMYIKDAKIFFSGIKDDQARRGFIVQFQVVDEDACVTRTSGDLEITVQSMGYFLTKFKQKIALKKEDFQPGSKNPKWLGYTFSHPQPILAHPLSSRDSYYAIIKIVTSEGKKLECDSNSIYPAYAD